MPNSPFPLGPNIIEDILHFSTIDIEANHHNRCSSTPGHLIHLVTEGHYRLSISNRNYDVKKGDLIYYYEAEDVHWYHNPVAVSFHTLAFLAPRLAPFPEDQRVFKSNQKIKLIFKKLNQLVSNEYTDAFRPSIYSSVNALVSEIITFKKSKLAKTKTSNAWMRVESLIRSQKLYKSDLSQLSTLVMVSSATLSRACHLAYETSPMKRLREIRMEYAKGLLRYSPLNISHIAYELGYSRVHEFSREFRKVHDISPTEFRSTY